MKKKRIAHIIIGMILVVSIGANIYLATHSDFDSKMQYLQTPQQIKIAYSGILKGNEEFRAGEDVSIIYDLNNKSYPVLLEKYNISETAGAGSESKKAIRLMNEYAPRLTHQSDFDQSVEMSALPLLEYSLDKPKSGINCRCKAQIFNEMLLALGIYSRKLWINPQSMYDGECHVINEVWDLDLNKWVMVDISNNIYWVDENRTPLSVLEIRHLAANQEFCTPVHPDDDLSNLDISLNENYGLYLYYLKNLVYTYYCDIMTTHETETMYFLIPKNISIDDSAILISEESVNASPK